MKKTKLFLTALLIAALPLSLFPAAAAGAVDPDTDRGSITVTLKRYGLGVAGLQVTLHRVGVGKVEDSQLLFDLLPELEGTAVELNGLTGAENTQAAAKLLAFLHAQQPAPVTALVGTTGDSGAVVFDDLPVGIYLVQSAATPSYQAITPYLLQLPAQDASGAEWDFDIHGAPKVQVQPSGGDDEDEDDPPVVPPPDTPPDVPPETPPPFDPGEDPSVPDPPAPEEPVPELPQTGLLQWPIPLLAAAGLLLIVLGLRTKQKEGCG